MFFAEKILYFSKVRWIFFVIYFLPQFIWNTWNQNWSNFKIHNILPTHQLQIRQTMNIHKVAIVSPRLSGFEVNLQKRWFFSEFCLFCLHSLSSLFNFEESCNRITVSLHSGFFIFIFVENFWIDKNNCCYLCAFFILQSTVAFLCKVKKQ